MQRAPSPLIPCCSPLPAACNHPLCLCAACGFTPQYKELEELHQKYKDRGLTVIGFPCNQFGSQEKGTEEEIETFVCTKFKASFPMMAKINVNGSEAHPLYVHLKKEKSGFLGMSRIPWNFAKYLLDKQGNVVDRYAPTTSPMKLASDIEKLL